MTTKVQEDVSFEEFKRTMESIREHNKRRMDAVSKGAPDPGSLTLPGWAQKRENEDFSTLPSSTLSCFEDNKNAHNGRLRDNQQNLQTAADQRVDDSMSQEDYERELNQIKNNNKIIRDKNEDALFNRLIEEGKKYPDKRKKITTASHKSGDFVTGIWVSVGNKIAEVVVNVLKSIGQWVADRIKDVVDWFKSVFHF